MNRRQFLTRALAAVPIVLAGEQLAELLVPRRTIFLPPRGGWGGPTTLELLQAYVDRIRPVGAIIDCVEMDTRSWDYIISELNPGHLLYSIPRDIPPALDRRMRIALTSAPTPSYPTRANLTPWESLPMSWPAGKNA